MLHEQLEPALLFALERLLIREELLRNRISIWELLQGRGRVPPGNVETHVPAH